MMEFYIFSDEYFMGEAIKEAKSAEQEGEIPIGAVVVWKKRIIARSHNMTERLNDVTAHAEMLAITAATNYIGGKYLKDCALYVTIEPCPMCASALSWAQIGENRFWGSCSQTRLFSHFIFFIASANSNHLRHKKRRMCRNDKRIF